MSYLKKAFGYNLRLLRKSRNLTQEKLAEMVNLNQRQLTRIETGLSFVSSDVLEKLVIALNVDIKDLFAFELKESLLEKTGTDNTLSYKIYSENNVIHIQKCDKESFKKDSDNNIVNESPDKYLSEVSKKINKPITAQYMKDGIIDKTYIYNPDGSVNFIQTNYQKPNFENIEKILNKLKKIADNENKINYINLAIDSLNDKKALNELKMLIKGIELTLDDK